MPETRYIITFKDGKEVSREPYIVTDEQIADETEANALSKVDDLIDQITTLAQVKVFLKRLCARLIKKRLLP